MKNGAVLAKLANDKRVAQLNLTSDNEQVTIVLAPGYVREFYPTGRGTFRTAKQAHAFIRGAKKAPIPAPGNEIVISLMSGKPVEQRIGTPRCCDPSTELYWSM